MNNNMNTNRSSKNVAFWVVLALLIVLVAIFVIKTISTKPVAAGFAGPAPTVAPDKDKDLAELRSRIDKLEGGSLGPKDKEALTDAINDVAAQMQKLKAQGDASSAKLADEVARAVDKVKQASDTAAQPGPNQNNVPPPDVLPVPPPVVANNPGQSTADGGDSSDQSSKNDATQSELEMAAVGVCMATPAAAVCAAAAAFLKIFNGLSGPEKQTVLKAIQAASTGQLPSPEVLSQLDQIIQKHPELTDKLAALAPNQSAIAQLQSVLHARDRLKAVLPELKNINEQNQWTTTCADQIKPYIGDALADDNEKRVLKDLVRRQFPGSAEAAAACIDQL